MRKAAILKLYLRITSGEKLYEELLADSENTYQRITSNLIGKVREYEYNDVAKIIEELIQLFDTQNNTKIVQCMKELVPEFKSNNSVFERLDN